MKKKILYSIFLGAVLSSTGAAAITGGGGGGGVNFIFDAFSGIVAGEVNSWMDLLLVVILPFLGVYGVSRYLTGKALEIAESNFAGSDSYGGTELGSTEKRMAQFISLAIAAPVVMYFGNIIPFFSLLLSGIAVIWFGWQFIGGGLASKWSTDSSITGSSSSSPSESNKEEMQKIQKELEKEREQRQEVEQELEDIKQREQQDEEAVESHDESADQAEDHIEVEINEIEDAEKKLESMEQLIADVESDVLNEEDKVAKEEKDLEQTLSKAENLEERTGQALESVNKVVKEMDNHPEWFEGAGELPKKTENGVTLDLQAIESEYGPDSGSPGENMKKFIEQVIPNRSALEGVEGGLVNPLQQVINWQSSEFDEIETSVDEAEDVYQTVKIARRSLRQLNQDLEAIKEDIQVLEQEYDEEEKILQEVELLAEKEGDKQDYKKLKEQDEDEYVRAGNELKQVANRFKQLYQRTQKLEEKINSEYKEEEKIISEFEQLHEHINNIEDNLIQMKKDLAARNQEYEQILSNEESASAKQLENELDNVDPELAQELARETPGEDIAGISPEQIKAKSEGFRMSLRIIVENVEAETGYAINILEKCDEAVRRFLEDVEQGN